LIADQRVRFAGVMPEPRELLILLLCADDEVSSLRSVVGCCGLRSLPPPPRMHAVVVRALLAQSSGQVRSSVGAGIAVDHSVAVRIRRSERLAVVAGDEFAV